MKTTHLGMIETVKGQIVAAIKETGNIVQATVDTVAQILATTIKDTGKVGTSVTDVVTSVASGAIHGAAHVGEHRFSSGLGRSAARVQHRDGHPRPVRQRNDTDVVDRGAHAEQRGSRARLVRQGRTCGQRGAKPLRPRL